MNPDSSFEVLREIISEVCNVPLESFTRDVNLVEDLGIDSIDFLDVTFEIERRFSIKLPVEEWGERIANGEPIAEYFVMSRFVAQVDALIRSSRGSVKSA